MHRTRFSLSAVAAMAAALAAPAQAQDVEAISDAAGGDTVFEGDWLAIGVGVGVGPTYDGSDDYKVFPAPIMQGELGGIGIAPRAGGFALDFVPDAKEGISITAGPSLRLRRNRTGGIKDPVVESLGELDTALEIGPTAGLTIPKVLHDYDSLSLSVEARWDVLGAHNGMVVAPNVTYFTPLSRGAAVALVADVEYADGDFMDYYYSVTPEGAAASGLPVYDADSGFTKAGVTLIGGIDLNGDLADGGLSLVLVGGYSRMLGNAADSPVVSERGSADQWLGAVGLGFVF